MEKRRVKTKNANDLFHQGPADFSNLEIRSTWSGKVNEPADLQISLHVMCTPNTQLPFLNLRPSYISLVKTSVHCLAAGSGNGESGESPPRSPLFAFAALPSGFSAPVSDNEEGGEGSVYDECWDEDGPSGLPIIPEEDELLEMGLPEPGSDPEPLDEDGEPDEESPISVSAPTIASTDGSVSENALTELGLTPYPEDAGESGEHTMEREQKYEQRDRRDSALSLFQLSPLLEYPPELPYEESTFSQSLGKRSAADACLSDPEQDAEEKRTYRRSVSMNSNGSVCSIGIDFATPAEETESQTHHASDSIEENLGRHSNRLNLIPERVSMGGLPPEQQQHSESDNPHQEETEAEDAFQRKKESTVSTDKSIPDTSFPKAVATDDVGTQLIVEELDTQTKVASDELLISSDTDEDTLSESEKHDPELGSSTPVKPSNPVIPLTPTSLMDTVAHDGVTSHTKTEKDVEAMLGTPKAASDGLILPPGAKGTPNEDEEDDDPGSPTPVRPTRLIIPPTKALVNEDTKIPSMPSGTNVAYPESELFQHVTSEPELDLKDGILLVSNPPQANYLTYKISITVSVHLQKGKLHGWHDLVIPGLPRVRNGESGYLIFLLPDGCGMEFRTTNFRRNKFVENCFFAEFAISGDLVIPLRVCDLRSYGIVKDFTVDYELLIDHDILDGNKVSVAYNAVCELKLPNRRIWADKCCFFLDIEGGPEGFYQYELDQPCTKFPIIYLASWDRPMGVAHVQVICPLKVMEMFCITWDTKDLTRLETKWIPRIYPGSPGVNGQQRQSLRKKFIDALGAANCYEFVDAEYDDMDVEDSDPEVSLHYAFWNDDASQGKEVDKISGKKGSPRLQVELKRSVSWPVMVILAMAVILILRAFDPMGRPWSMESTANATHVGAQDAHPYYTNANKEYHVSNDTSADDSHEGGLSTNGTLDVDQGSSEDETLIEGEKAELEMSSALGDSDVKPEESDQPESGVKPGPSATKLPFRDRVDYLLGWKGPTSQSRNEVS